MTLTLSHEEALLYLANLEQIKDLKATVQRQTIVTTMNTTAPRPAPESVNRFPTPFDPEPAPFHTAVHPVPKPKPVSTRQKLTQAHLDDLLHVANSPCIASSAIDTFAAKRGYTTQYIATLVRKSKQMRLVKGRDIPQSDVYKSSTMIDKKQYIRSM